MSAVPDRCWRCLTDNRQARRAPLSAQRSASLLPLPDGVSVLPSARRASVCCPLPDERQRAALCPTIVSLLPLARRASVSCPLPDTRLLPAALCPTGVSVLPSARRASACCALPDKRQPVCARHASAPTFDRRRSHPSRRHIIEGMWRVCLLLFVLVPAHE